MTESSISIQICDVTDFGDILNVKCDPILIGALRREKGFYPVGHMNKSSWLAIDIEDVKEDEIKILVDMS